MREGNWLAAHLRGRRHELELSQEEVADRTGMPLLTICRLERGDGPRSLHELRRVLEALDEELVIGPSRPRRPTPPSSDP
jgi:predicted transcriptional regulator